MKILFCGDLYKKPEDKCPVLDSRLREIIHNHDFSFVNLEAPIVSGQLPIKKIGPSLKMDLDAIKVIEAIGFNFASLANNHAMDYGPESIAFTRDNLCIKTFGAGTFEEAYSPVFLEKEGLKVAVFSASEKQFGAIEDRKDKGYSWINHPYLWKTIRETAGRVDKVILFAHCGLEDVDIPLPQWRETYKSLLDTGVDVIVATHPHRMQGYEIYDNKPIFYSMGNFFFGYKKDDDWWNEGYAVSLEIHPNKKIEWSRLPHKIGEDNMIRLSDRDLTYLDRKIESVEYQSQIASICLQMWERIYIGYYERAMVSINNKNLLQIFKTIIMKWTGKYRINHRLLWHNIAIESHRYVTEIALKELSKND